MVWVNLLQLWKLIFLNPTFGNSLKIWRWSFWRTRTLVGHNPTESTLHCIFFFFLGELTCVVWTWVLGTPSSHLIPNISKRTSSLLCRTLSDSMESLTLHYILLMKSSCKQVTLTTEAPLLIDRKSRRGWRAKAPGSESCWRLFSSPLFISVYLISLLMANGLGSTLCHRLRTISYKRSDKIGKAISTEGARGWVSRESLHTFSARLEESLGFSKSQSLAWARSWQPAWGSVVGLEPRDPDSVPILLWKLPGWAWAYHTLSTRDGCELQFGSWLVVEPWTKTMTL